MKKIFGIFLVVCLLVDPNLGQTYYDSDYTGAEIDSATGHFIGDNYNRYVGGGEKNYPLTVSGVAQAMASLDSGTVFISYPGIPDTSGMGTIPDLINLDGWLLNKQVKLYKAKTGYSNLYRFNSKNYYYNEGNGIMQIGFNTKDVPTSTSAGLRITGYAAAPLTGQVHAAGMQIVMFKGDESADAGWNSTTQGLFGIVSTVGCDNASTIARATGVKVEMNPGSSGIFTTSIAFDAKTPDVSGAGSIGTHYAFLSQTQDSKTITNKYGFYQEGASTYNVFEGISSTQSLNYAADTSSTDAYKIVLKGSLTLTAGLEVTFKAVTANTDGATLTVNSLTATAITKCASGAVNTALATGDIIAGQIVKCVYDGTQFQIISRLAQ